MRTKGDIGRTFNFTAPEATFSFPELSKFRSQPTQDVYSFGLVTYQIVSNGTRPYENEYDVVQAKAVDSDLSKLFATIPIDAPQEFRRVIYETTRHMPFERSSLDEVERFLHNYIDTHQVIKDLPACNHLE